MDVKSSSTHVFPTENVPLTFSRALCMRTRPDFRTPTTMTRGFLLSGRELPGGGADGYAASSSMRICVMYDSDTNSTLISQIHVFTGSERLQDPSASFLLKQLSIKRLFSSSNFSALETGGPPPLAVGIGDAIWPLRLSYAGLGAALIGEPFGRGRGRCCPYSLPFMVSVDWDC